MIVEVSQFHKQSQDANLSNFGLWHRSVFPAGNLDWAIPRNSDFTVGSNPNFNITGGHTGANARTNAPNCPS